MRILDRQSSLPSRSLRRAIAGLTLAALASLALIAAGCGGGSSGSSVAQAPTSTTETRPSQSGESEDGATEGNPAAFSACMRSHGVPKFPDPDSTGRFRFRAGPGTGIDPESSQFKAADDACRKLAPEEKPPSPAQQAQDRAQLLRFSACMRSHGLPKFPDPQADGLRINRNSGIDPHSPQFKAAQKACENFLPGSPGASPHPEGTP
jgi:hypothetical protein